VSKVREFNTILFTEFFLMKIIKDCFHRQGLQIYGFMGTIKWIIIIKKVGV